MLPQILSILAIIISIIGMIIAFKALHESSLANRLNIEPLITIHSPHSFTGVKLPLIIKNRGKVDVEDFTIVWATRQKSPKSLSPKILSGSYPLYDEFKVGDEKSFQLDLKEQIEEKRKDKGGNVFYLAIKPIYRRAVDAKAGENSFYFMISLHSFGISVEDITTWKTEPILNIKKELNKFI